jgi:two-component system, OmpR family, phosphate regulon response regulator PhoB
VPPARGNKTTRGIGINEENPRRIVFVALRFCYEAGMAKVLVVEDEADIRDVLEYNLAENGHQVVTAGTAAEALRCARERVPDLVLLDLMLPDRSGREVCKELRADRTFRDTRIMMLTARGEEVDRVVGFELGADDYVLKPFSIRELMLRIDAVLRRAAPLPPSVDLFDFGILRVDREAHRIWVNDAELELTALEFKLLVTLHDRRNRVQTRSTLLNDVWGIEADITTRTVDTHVKRLREKLGAAGDYVETVRGVGYRFADTPNGTASTRGI